MVPWLRSLPRALLSMAAAALAYCGQALLVNAQPFGWFAPSSLSADLRLRAGWMLLVTGGLFFALAWRRSPTNDSDPLLVASAADPSAGSISWRRWGLVASALLVYAANIADWLLRGESTSTRWLWLLSIALIVLSQVPANMRRSPRRQRSSDIPAGIAAAALLLIVGLGFCLRYVDLTRLPFDVHGDTTSRGLHGRTLNDAGWPFLVGVVGWRVPFPMQGYGLPYLGYAATAAGLRLFGDNLYGLRLTGVLEGTVTLVGTYLLTALLFDRRVALAATAISAIGYADIHFSRLGGYMSPVPWMLFALYFLLRGLRRNSPLSLTLSGVLLAADLLLYFSSRIVVVLVGVFLIYVAVLHPQLIRRRRNGLVLFVLAGLVTFGPMLAFFAVYPGALTIRSDEVFLFTPAVMQHLQNKYHVATALGVLREQIFRSLLMFNWTTDTSDQFGFPHPLINPCLAPLLVLGVAFAATRLRHSSYVLSLIWLSLVVVVGAILTANAPFWPRLVILLPVAAIFTAIGLDRLRAAVVAVLGGGAWSRRLTRLLALLLLGWVGVQNWAWYTRLERQHTNPRAWLGRLIAQSPAQTKFCIVQGQASASDREIEFLGKGHDVRGFFRLEAETFLPQCLAEDRVLVLFSPNHDDLLKELEARWANARIERHPQPDGLPGPIFWYPPPEAVHAAAEGKRPLPPTQATETSGEGAVYRGSTDGRPYAIALGAVTITGAALEVTVSAVHGADCVYDYVEAIGPSGETIRVEAEDPHATSGDTPTKEQALDNHWWLQSYQGFSGGKGLVALKTETPPPLVTRIPLAPGTYQVRLGSFTGDPANGPFAIRVKMRDASGAARGGRPNWTRGFDFVNLPRANGAGVRRRGRNQRATMGAVDRRAIRGEVRPNVES